MSNTYTTKGKNEWATRWTVQSINDPLVYLKAEMDHCIGIPVERMGRTEAAILFQKELSINKPRDIDIELARAIDRAEEEGKHLILSNKRYRP